MIHLNFEPHLSLIKNLLRKYGIKNAYCFGSVLTNNFNDNSDLDLLINFNPEITDPLVKGKLMWDLQFEIEDSIKRNVDLLQESRPKNPYFLKELAETRELIYEQ